MHLNKNVILLAAIFAALAAVGFPFTRAERANAQGAVGKKWQYGSLSIEAEYSGDYRYPTWVRSRRWQDRIHIEIPVG